MGSVKAFPAHPIAEQMSCNVCDVICDEDQLDDDGQCERCRSLDEDYRRQRNQDMAAESAWGLDNER